MKISICLALASFLSVHSFQFAGAEERVIYGEDDRKEVSDPDNDPIMVEVSKSTAILVRKSSIRSVDETTSRLPSTTFGRSSNLCEDEPFKNQPNPGFCSGFLVGPDILVTAGHCVRTRSDCNSTAFVFDFYDRKDPSETSTILTNNAYFCKEIIAQELNRSTQNDFAVIRLDRKVEDRTPLKFRREGKVETNTSLTVIGHPSGLPTKIAGGAIVRSNSHDVFFEANLDTYGGNSGSAVFNSQGEVEGILVRGEQDFEIRGSCRVSKQCDDDKCRGEDVTRATMFASFVPDPEEEERERRELTPVVVASPIAIPDRNFEGISVPLQISENGTIAEVAVILELEHSYPGDLVVKLQHPDGTQATLRDRTSQDGGSIQWSFGYEGDTAPELRKFRDKNSAGTWQLIVIDTAVDDLGTLKSSTLKIRVYDN